MSNCPLYREIVKIFKDNGTEIEVISNDEILTTVHKYPYIMDALFNVETEALDEMTLFVGNKQGVEIVNSRKTEIYKESNKILSFPKVFEQFIKYANEVVERLMDIDLNGDLVFDFLKRIVRKSIDLDARYIDMKTILELGFWSEYILENDKLKFCWLLSNQVCVMIFQIMM